MFENDNGLSLVQTNIQNVFFFSDILLLLLIVRSVTLDPVINKRKIIIYEGIDTEYRNHYIPPQKMPILTVHLWTGYFLHLVNKLIENKFYFLVLYRNLSKPRSFQRSPM